MVNQCKDCRFYDGKNCAVSKAPRASNFSCGVWVSSTASPTVKQCKACRFYDGKNCSAQGGGVRASNFTCGKWAAFK